MRRIEMSFTTRWGLLLLIVGVSAATLGAAGNSVSLIDAVRSGDASTVRTLLQRSEDANAASPDGTSALLWAVYRNNVDIVDLLLGAGAKPGTANRYGVVPLAQAAENGDPAIVNRLL